MSYHINKKGAISPCKNEEKCKIEKALHFNNESDAIEYADKFNQMEYGLILDLGKEAFKYKDPSLIDYFKNHTEVIEIDSNCSIEKLRETEGKDISVYYDFEIVTGVVMSVSKDRNRKLKISTANGFRDIELMNPMPNALLVSKLPYYSETYQSLIRELKIPKHTFRYQDSDLKNIAGVYYRASTGLSTIMGKVVGYSPEDGVRIDLRNETGGVNSCFLYELEDFFEITRKSKDFLIYVYCTQVTKAARALKKPRVPLKLKPPEGLISKYLSNIINSGTLEISEIYSWKYSVENMLNEYYEDGVWTTHADYSYRRDLESGEQLDEYYEAIIREINKIVDLTNRFDWRALRVPKLNIVTNVLLCIQKNNLLYK